MTTKEAVKHTPGPWQTTGFHGRTETIRSQPDTRVCIAMMPEWEDEFRPEKEANARLIAAAPQMLEALKIMRDAVAGAMRVLHSHGIVDPFLEEMARIGIPNGFGKAADDLIAQVEGR